MMKEIDFDNYVKDQLYDHTSPIPQGMWEKIVIEKEHKKPAAIWWLKNKWYMLLAAFMLLIGSSYLAQNIEKIDNLISENKDIQKTAIPTKMPNSKLPITNKENEAINKNIALNSEKNNTINTNISVATTQSQTNNNTTRESKLENQFLQSGEFKKPSTDKYQKDMRITEPLTSPNNSIAVTQVQTDNDDFTTHFIKENTISLTNLSKFEIKNPTSLQITNNYKIFGLSCPNTSPSNWYLEVYGSPDYASKKVYAYGVNDAYLQRIDSTTKMNGGFTVGARISKSISNNILLKSGLQYTQRNEQFTSKSDSIITTTSVVTVRTIVRGGGLSDTTVRDTSLLQQIGYRKRITNNQYKSIEVPLLLSYERGNDKWRVAINGGIIANLSSWYNGETLDTSYQLIPLSAKKSNGFYKSNLNLSLYAGISILRRVSNKIEAFAEPYFRYGLSNSNTSTIGYSQRFNAAGISFGIRYKLNGKSSNATN